MPPAYHPAGPPRFGPQPGFGPVYRYPVAKKSNTALVASLSVLGVFVVVGGLIAAFALSGGSSRRQSADAGYESYPTTTTSSERTSTSSTRTSTTTSRSTGTSTRTTDRTTATKSTPSGPQPSPTLGTNPLFAKADGGLPNTACKLAKWATNPDAAAAFFESARKCLDAPWKEAMAYANLPFRVPTVKYPSGTNWSSPCGGVSKGQVAAFYCSQNETLYMPFEGLQTKEHGNKPGVYLALFAHEYGHHVQALSGMTDVYWDKRYEAGTDSAAGLELSRRFELQAQCFSGMYLGSTVDRGGDVNQPMYRDAWQTQNRGDHGGGPRDHGSDAHAVSWWQQGALKNRSAQCNTWASPVNDVS